MSAQVPDMPQIVYHPKSPRDLRIITNEVELFKMYHLGFRTIRLDRLGSLVRRARKTANATIEEFQQYLQKYGIFFSTEALYKIERGDSNFKLLNIAMLKALAEALHMPVEDLVRPMPRERASTKAQKIRINSRKNSSNKDALCVFEASLYGNGEYHRALWLAPDKDEARKMIRAEFPSFEVTELVPVDRVGLLAFYKETE